MSFQSIGELTNFIYNLTNVTTTFETRLITNNEFIVIDIIGDNTIYADNKIFDYEMNFQLTYATKQKGKKLQFNKILKENLNATMSTTYDQESEYFTVVYEFTAEINSL